MNQHTIERGALLARPVWGKFVDADVVLQKQSITTEITQGGRTWEEQAAIYAQGRESLPQVNALRAAVHQAPITEDQNRFVQNQLRISQGKPAIVETHAKPGTSYHNYFMAFDAVPFVAGEPLWVVTDPRFEAMVAAFRSVGLFCGIDWPEPNTDSDHFQFTGRFGEKPDAEMIEIFKDSGQVAVWEAAYRIS